MKIRQVALLVVVGTASIWGGYTGYNRFLVGETKAASIQSQVATVARGTLKAAVNASGSAIVTRQAKLSFGSAGSLGDLAVKMGDQVKAGKVLARLDPTTVASLNNAVTQAESTLNIARLNLAQTQNPYTAVDLASAERTVRQAEASLQVAQRGLESALNPYSELDLSQAEGAVRNATAALETAKGNLSLAQNDPASNDNLRTLEDQASYYIRTYNATFQRFEEGRTGQDKVNQDYSNMLTAQEKLAAAREKQAITLANARNEVAKAQDTLTRAQDDLAKKKAGPDASDVDGKRAQVINLETALARAQEDLAKKQAGGDPRDIEKQNNTVASAQAALDTARLKLQGAIIVAPFDGVVASVGLNLGEQVGANTVVLTLVDPQALRIDVNVAESDIASLRPGQAATITFDALAGQTFQAKVDGIAPSAKVQQGVVNYLVSLTLEATSGVKDGMTASSQIVYQQRDNILVVPNRAIRTQGRTRTVQVLLPSGATETRTIRTGMSGDQTTEVVEGLQEGEKVTIPTTATTSQTSGFGGGGLPGGGSFFTAPAAKP